MATKGELTKQRILKVSAEMFWKNSYHSVKVDQIVVAAKVNKASFYQYFKNKEQAALESIEYMFQRTRSFAFDGSFANKTEPEDRLSEIFKRIYGIHQELLTIDGRTPGCPFVNMGNEMAMASDSIRNKIENVFESFCSYHADIYKAYIAQNNIRGKINSKRAARQIQGILNGAMTSAKIRNRPKDILEALESAKLILSAI